MLEIKKKFVITGKNLSEHIKGTQIPLIFYQRRGEIPIFP